MSLSGWWVVGRSSSQRCEDPASAYRSHLFHLRSGGLINSQWRSSELKRSDIVRCLPVNCEIAHDLAYEEAKFKAVARKPGCDEGIGLLRQGVEYEVGIRGH